MSFLIKDTCYLESINCLVPEYKRGHIVNNINIYDDFKNKKILLTGHQSLKVIDLLSMIAEMLDIPSSSIEFKNTDYQGHYVRTPFHYESDTAEKYVPQTYVDLGEGILNMIKNIKDNFIYF